MESSSSSPDEVNSNSLSKNKRKLQDGLQEMPLPKHVCWAQVSKPDPPSDFWAATTVVENVESRREIESDPESAKDSNSFQCSRDSAMATEAEYFGLNASEESSSTCTGCLGYEGGPALNYEGHLIEFGGEAENCADEDIENMLYLKGIAPSDYVLSSGRWPVFQDTLEENKKPTIDKEFEEYFSMLML